MRTNTREISRDSSYPLIAIWKLETHSGRIFRRFKVSIDLQLDAAPLPSVRVISPIGDRNSRYSNGRGELGRNAARALLALYERIF